MRLSPRSADGCSPGTRRPAGLGDRDSAHGAPIALVPPEVGAARDREARTWRGAGSHGPSGRPRHERAGPVCRGRRTHARGHTACSHIHTHTLAWTCSTCSTYMHTHTRGHTFYTHTHGHTARSHNMHMHTLTWTYTWTHTFCTLTHTHMDTLHSHTYTRTVIWTPTWTHSTCFTYTHMHTRGHTQSTHSHTHAHHTHTHMDTTHSHMHTHRHTFMLVHTRSHPLTRVCIHVHTTISHTYTRAYICVHTHTRFSSGAKGSCRLGPHHRKVASQEANPAQQILAGQRAVGW